MYPDSSSIRPFIVASLVVLVAGAGCASPESTPESDAASVQPEAEPNSLTQEEIAAGWELLFDGESLAGWHKYGGDPVGAAWTVEDGAITLIPQERDDWQTLDGGDIVSDAVFEDFDLMLEWKISENGNSGIMYLVDESDEWEYPWETGLEMQVLHNEGHPDGQVEKHRAGDLYDLIAAPDGLTRPVGEWNQVRIVKRGPNVEQWFNGTLAAAFTLWTDEWNALVDSSKFAEMEAFGESRSGRISLQDHGDWVAFRAIKVRRL